MGKIPKRGRGIWPKPTFSCLFAKFFFTCQNDPEVLKHVLFFWKKSHQEKTVFIGKKFPQGGALQRGNFPHVFPSFLTASLRDAIMEENVFL